jgi:hypothetical protein
MLLLLLRRDYKLALGLTGSAAKSMLSLAHSQEVTQDFRFVRHIFKKKHKTHWFTKDAWLCFFFNWLLQSFADLGLP